MHWTSCCRPASVRHDCGMAQTKSTRSGWARFLVAVDQVTQVRLLLLCVVLVLVLVHGLWPKVFLVDAATIGLVALALLIALVPLIKSATLPGGGGFELRESLYRLNNESARATRDQARNESPTTNDRAPGGSAPERHEMDDEVERERGTEDKVVEILREASRSPRVGLIMLSGELEFSINELLAMTGWETPASSRSIAAAVDRLVEVGVLTQSAASALTLYREVRNQIMHGRQSASDDEVLVAIDSGLSLYRAVATIPREHNVVVDPNVPLFSDANGRHKVAIGHGVLLRTTSPGGTSSSLRIFPTTRTDLVPGREVTWEWSFDHVWDETWYRDPENGAIVYAWTSSAEFRGRHLNQGK